MGNDAKKAEMERACFRDFVEVAGLSVVPESIESRKAPEPDILCSIEGRGPVAFELVEWVDQPLAEMESLAARGQQPEGIAYGKTFLECLRPKIRDRTYETRYPIELLVWGGESELELAVPVDPSVADRAQQLLDDSVFQRLWVVRFGRHESTIWLSLERSTRSGGAQSA